MLKHVARTIVMIEPVSRDANRNNRQTDEQAQCASRLNVCTKQKNQNRDNELAAGDPKQAADRTHQKPCQHTRDCPDDGIARQFKRRLGSEPRFCNKQQSDHEDLAMLIVPISFTANVIRVITLTLITYYWGDEVGQGFVHGFAGILLFFVALISIMTVDSILQYFVKLKRKHS